MDATALCRHDVTVPLRRDVVCRLQSWLGAAEPSCQFEPVDLAAADSQRRRCARTAHQAYPTPTRSHTLYARELSSSNDPRPAAQPRGIALRAPVSEIRVVTVGAVTGAARRPSMLKAEVVSIASLSAAILVIPLALSIVIVLAFAKLCASDVHTRALARTLTDAHVHTDTDTPRCTHTDTHTDAHTDTHAEAQIVRRDAAIGGGGSEHVSARRSCARRSARRRSPSRPQS